MSLSSFVVGKNSRLTFISCTPLLTLPPKYTNAQFTHTLTLRGNLESSFKLMCMFLDFRSALQPSPYVDQLINRFCVVSGRDNFTLQQLNNDTAAVFCDADINFVF